MSPVGERCVVCGGEGWSRLRLSVTGPRTRSLPLPSASSWNG